MSPSPIANKFILIPNQVLPIPTSNCCIDIYSSNLEDDPVFEDMVSNHETVNSIDTYSVLPQRLTLSSTSTKVLKKQRKTRVGTQIATIKWSQSDTTASARFLLTALHSVSQAITCAYTDNISLYNNTDTFLCAESGVSEDMFPEYSTCKTYHRLSNCYATVGFTTSFPVEVIGTVVYTLNVRTILIHNALHIPALQGPLYSLCKHRQIPGCGVYSSNNYGSYIFFPDFILQVE